MSDRITAWVPCDKGARCLSNRHTYIDGHHHDIFLERRWVCDVPQWSPDDCYNYPVEPEWHETCGERWVEVPK